MTSPSTPLSQVSMNNYLNKINKKKKSLKSHQNHHLNQWFKSKKNISKIIFQIPLKQNQRQSKRRDYLTIIMSWSFTLQLKWVRATILTYMHWLSKGKKDQIKARNYSRNWKKEQISDIYFIYKKLYIFIYIYNIIKIWIVILFLFIKM